MKYLLTLAAFVLILSPALVRAQAPTDAPNAFLVGSWKCDITALDDVVEYSKNVILPISQELVDEGLILEAGLLTHFWGDEWNYIDYIIAENAAAGIEASTERLRRLNERHPDDQYFMENCFAHKDNIYQTRLSTERRPVFDEASPAVVAFSYWNCELNRLNGILNGERDRTMPVVQELVDEGKFRFTGYLTHSWGDEWSLVRLASAPTLSGLMDAFDEQESRLDERHPDRPSIGAVCREHKDNLYFLRLQTTARQ